MLLSRPWSKAPHRERLFAAVEKEVSSAIDAEVGPVRSVLTLAIGTKRYRDLKGVIVAKVLEKMPETMEEANQYASEVVDLEQLIVEKVGQLSDEQYESILRPIFKDDEMLMVTFGAMLGLGIGELPGASSSNT